MMNEKAWHLKQAPSDEAENKFFESESIKVDPIGPTAELQAEVAGLAAERDYTNNLFVDAQATNQTLREERDALLGVLKQIRDESTGKAAKIRGAFKPTMPQSRRFDRITKLASEALKSAKMEIHCEKDDFTMRAGFQRGWLSARLNPPAAEEQK